MKIDIFLNQKKMQKKIKNLFFQHLITTLLWDLEEKIFQKNFQTSLIWGFPNFSQFSNFVWDNGDGDGDATDENFAMKLREGIVNMYKKGMGNLKRVVMAKRTH